MHQAGLFDLTDKLKRLSAKGDPLEALACHVDFEAFRPALTKALDYGDRSKGRRPPYDPVAMFKVLVLASMHNVSDERMEFLIRDRLSWQRFLGFRIGKRTPDAKTIWLFRESLVRAGVFKTLFSAFEKQLRDRGYTPAGGQIVDATLVSAPRQRQFRINESSELALTLTAGENSNGGFGEITSGGYNKDGEKTKASFDICVPSRTPGAARSSSP